MNARRKILTTGAIRSRKLAQASCMAERMYWRIYMASDNYGTMSADPWDVWQAAAPGVTGLNENKVAQAIDELADLGLVLLFHDANQKIWLHVIGHDKHQSTEFIRKRGKRHTPVPPNLPEFSPIKKTPNQSLYLIEAVGAGLYKIGVSANPQKRLEQLQTGSQHELVLVDVVDNVGTVGEREFMSVFSHDKHRHEWFRKNNKMLSWFADMKKRPANETVETGRDQVGHGRDNSPPLTSTSTSTSKEEISIDILSEKPSGSHDISEIFDHWVGLTYTGKGPKPKLSPKRKQRIKARIADGWTVEQLKQALTGYSRDPFWRGENDGKPKLELAYRLGSTEEVERGLSLHADPARTPMSNDDKWAFYAGQGEAS